MAENPVPAAEVMHRPWIIRSERSVLSRPPFLEVSEQTVQLPDGRVVDDFYQIAMADYTCVFPEMPDGRILLLRSYRHGPRRVCLTFPGGQVGAGEQPLDGARRELLEETGFASEEWRHLGSFITQANQRCQSAHLFQARRCRAVQPANSGDLEHQEIVALSRAEAMEAFRRGEFAILEHAAVLALALGAQLCSPVE